MALSIDLISQFAKITKDKETSKKETTVYGTIAEYNGRKCVKLDGSELYTPIMTTVEAEVGERVTVLLKNHTATVTGNITSPAVRTETVRIIVDNVSGLEEVLEDTVSDEELGVEQQRITNLEQQNAIITEALGKKLDSDVASNTYATKTAIDGLNNTISGLSNTISQQNSTISGLSNTISQQSAKIAALEARIAALEGGA